MGTIDWLFFCFDMETFARKRKYEGKNNIAPNHTKRRPVFRCSKAFCHFYMQWWKTHLKIHLFLLRNGWVLLVETINRKTKESMEKKTQNSVAAEMRNIEVNWNMCSALDVDFLCISFDFQDKMVCNSNNT